MKEKRSKVKPMTSTKKRPVSKKPATTSRPITTGARKQSLPRPSVKSPAAITRPATGSLAEETQAQLDGLQDQLGRQQESLLLTSVQNDLEDIETGLAVLPTEIEELRTRGYVFCSFLENKINVLAGQWEETHERVSREVNKRVRELEREADEAESAMRQAMSGSSTQIARAESAIETLERKVSAARSATQAMYDTLQQNVRQTKAQVEQIRWLLDQIDEASFQLHPAEDPVAACKAQYLEREDEGPEGLLYLTDERLIFERKEKVATKKVLFITTEKETVQEFIFEVHIGQVEEVTASDKRKLLRRQEMLELLFAPEADLSGATLRLIDAQNEEWAQLIGRVKSGEIAKERTQPKDEAVVEAARTAPTKCTTCGATLSVEIVRGMREITCEYCGSVIRL
ncbi:MAG: hypothetical protein KKC18_01865 [Chloroflexi bacterium]|nr:hypothetical protein [Chloroflexota bacterium]